MFKEKIEIYNKQKTEFEGTLFKLRDEKSKVDMEEAKLGEGLKKKKEALTILQGESSIALERLNILQEKYKLLNEDLKREESLFKQNRDDNRASKSIKEKIQQIKVIDNEVIKLTASARKFRVELVNIEKQKADIDKSLRELTTSKTEIETSGKEKKAEIDRLTIQIVELCGFTPSKENTPKIEIEKVRNEIKDITLKETSLKEILEKENIEKQKVFTQKTSEEDKKEMLSKMLLEGQEKLNLSLKENYFETEIMASLYLVPREVLILLEKEIKQYEELKRNIIDNLRRVENLLNGKIVDPILFEELKVKREELGTILEEKTKAIGAQYRALEEMERKLQEVKNLIIIEKK